MLKEHIIVVLGYWIDEFISIACEIVHSRADEKLYCLIVSMQSKEEIFQFTLTHNFTLYVVRSEVAVWIHLKTEIENWNNNNIPRWIKDSNYISAMHFSQRELFPSKTNVIECSQQKSIYTVIISSLSLFIKCYSYVYMIAVSFFSILCNVQCTFECLNWSILTLQRS